MNRSKSPVDSFRFALNGVLLSYKTQRHLRIHFVLALLALTAGFILGFSRTELAVLVCAIAGVVMAELFNTAVETVVDLVTTDYHPLAKVAKDVAAGAVLVAALNAVLVGLLLFLKVPNAHEAPPAYQNAVQTCAIGLVILMLLLVMWKVRGGKGLFLRGGVVSGHTAVAFFLCTVILLLSPNPLVGVLAVVMAVIVSQTRVEAGIHTVQEVLFGALLGILIPVILYRLIPEILRHAPVRAAIAGS